MEQKQEITPKSDSFVYGLFAVISLAILSLLILGSFVFYRLTKNVTTTVRDSVQELQNTPQPPITPNNPVTNCIQLNFSNPHYQFEGCYSKSDYSELNRLLSEHSIIMTRIGYEDTRITTYCESQEYDYLYEWCEESRVSREELQSQVDTLDSQINLYISKGQ